MARVTRSKKIEIAEDSTALSLQMQDIDNQLQKSAALAEIDNAMPTLSDDATSAVELSSFKSACRTVIGSGQRGKKGKAKKKGKQGEADDTIDADVISGTESKTSMTEVNQDINVTIEEPRLKPAGRTTRKQAAKQAAEEALSKPKDNILEKASTRSDESSKLLENPENFNKLLVITKTPVKTLEEVEKLEGSGETTSIAAAQEGDDSFVQEIIARSPAKPVSRIEDSVEALDQLEEALEALDEAALAERMVSPEKTRKLASQKVSTRMVEESSNKRPSSSMATKSSHTSTRVKPTATRQTAVKKKTSMISKPTNDKTEENSKPNTSVGTALTKRPTSLIIQQAPGKHIGTKRPTSLIVSKPTVRSTKPPTKADFELPGEAVARKLKEKREARMAQRQSSEDSSHAAAIPIVKIKSTKAPTRPMFELPGEALSRKKKEEHEARIKAREEEEKKRREFKAKPVRSSVTSNYIPRETAASRARQSKVGIDVEDGNITVLKRGSTLGGPRPSIAQINTANTSAPRAPGPAILRKPSSAVAPKSTSAIPQHLQRTVSASEVHMQRQRGKEIYNRDAKMTEEIEREKREREAAAKRAREEAAERGRQASREWAEKQMARKMAGTDTGISAGYGPGGQLGLKT